MNMNVAFSLTAWVSQTHFKTIEAEINHSSISSICVILIKTKILGLLSHLENQEVPSLDQNTELFKLFAVFGQSHHLIIDTVLRGWTFDKWNINIKYIFKQISDILVCLW